MTVDTELLHAAVALVLGRTPGKALTHELGRVLDQQEEVLPWLILRENAFADDADVQGRLRALAAAGNRPTRQRPAGPVVAICTPVVKREIEEALGGIIADNVAGSDRADAIGALLHIQNSTLPGRPGYDFRRRIVELAPVTDTPADTDGESES